MPSNEWWKAVAFIVLHIIFTRLVHCNGKQFYDSRDDKCPSPKVYDVGHKYTPDLSLVPVANHINDMIAFIPYVSSLFLRQWAFFSYMAVLVAVRWVTTSVTILPRHKTCNDNELTWKNYITGHCYDKIFSAHFASTILFAYILMRTTSIGLPIISFVCICHAWLIIALRTHYTIDIVMSLIVAVAVTQTLSV